MIIFTSSNSCDFVKHFSCSPVDLNLKRFSDGGFDIKEFPKIPKSEVLLIIHSITSDRDFSELLMILFRYPVKIVCFPFNTYLRNHYGTELIVETLSKFGVEKIITLDAHTYHKNIININVFTFWKNILGKSYTIVSPDTGALTRNIYSDITLKKDRKADGNVQITESFGEIRDKKCLIIDDLIDTGRTINAASEFLFANGAKSVTVAATHAAISKGFIPLQKIERILVTNTIKHAKLHKKIQTIDISKFLEIKLRQFSGFN